MLKDKEIELIHLLFQSKNSPVTAKALADALNLSDRTVRTYIKNMARLFEDNGASIISKQGIGYTLEINQPIKFEVFLKQNDRQHILSLEEKQIAQTLNRQNYLLNQLVLNNACLKFEDLMAILFVSRSTLSKEFAKIKLLLSPYHLTIDWKAKKGVYVEGKEQDKRHFIMTYFFGQSYMSLLENHIGNHEFFKDIQLEKITMIVIEECHHANLKVYDFIIQNLILHLALSIKRFQDKLVIKPKGMMNLEMSSKEYQVAQRIVQRVEVLQGITFPIEEVYFLALHLFSKVNRQESAITVSEASQELIMQTELQQALVTIEQEQGLAIANDSQLFDALMTHLYTLKLRLLNDIKMTNPLLKQIKTEFESEFLMTKAYLGRLQLFSEHEISEDEWAYLTLHLMASIERNKIAQKIRVAVICATGFGSAQLLQLRVLKAFGERVDIKGVYGYFDLNQDMLKDIDVIISSIDLSKLVFAIPVVQVSVFFDENDIKTVRTYFDSFNTRRKTTSIESVSHVGKAEKIDLFHQIFKPECFNIFEQSIDKSTMIAHLLKQLAVDEKSSYQEQMLEQLDARERLSLITFSSTIAVPHPIVSQGNFPKIAVGLIPNGLFWNDAYPDIKFVFLLSPSYFDNSQLPIITKAVVSLLDLPDTQQELLRVENFSEFQQIFLRLL